MSKAVIVRSLQCILAIAYLALLFWSSTHKGWWLNIETVVIIGCMTGAGTVAFTLLMLWSPPLRFLGSEGVFPWFTTDRFLCKLTVLVIFEAVYAVAWASTFICMWFNKGKDYKKLFDRPPYSTWVLGVVIAGLETFSFVGSGIMVFNEKMISFRRARQSSHPLVVTAGIAP